MTSRFAYRDQRQGGVHTGRKYFINCSKCTNSNYWVVRKHTPDELISKHFRGYGWLVAKAQGFDICPACNGSRPANKLAMKFKVTEDGQEVPPPVVLAEQAEAERVEAQQRAFEAIDRHLGTPEPEKPAPEPASPVPEPEPDEPAAVPLATSEQIEVLVAEVGTMSWNIARLLDIVEKQGQDMTAALELQAEEQAKTLKALTNMVAGITSLAARPEAAPEQPKPKRYVRSKNSIWSPDDIYHPPVTTGRRA